MLGLSVLNSSRGWLRIRSSLSRSHITVLVDNANNGRLLIVSLNDPAVSINDSLMAISDLPCVCLTL